ncbi:fimbrial protein [Providencia rettgeri]|uniref:fimbrial protein n=1 Tax=Providencia rettgeri TaxID=587 RepID=UPI003D27DB7B
MSQSVIPRALFKNRLFVGIGVIGVLLGIFNRVEADTANLNLTLTIITPPQCTIRGGDSMTVSFGQVQQGLIDGVTYKRLPIDYQLSCSSVASNALTMSLSWSGVTINGTSAIYTNRNNLGIAIYRDSTRLGNGTNLNFNLLGTHPALYAVPVKPTGTMLTDAGPFNGAMTLTLNYQ